MSLNSAIKNRILQLLDEYNMSIYKLSAICAMPQSSIKNILYGKSQSPKVVTIKLICDGLGMTLAEFFDTEEFNHLDVEIK
ncbi:helix-turn-helix domain-containing protein [Butyricicoccus porcorum]|uniref:Transcriptional regulator n=1 Tax=Butyricicoccus porcorum TaxID=1945634 RepID=A0A252F842_9FIRM|nr:helix-turn-helix transcriptional regulator [Butyricicoccus porcorum]MDY4484252.1 helix-turn-helix transcriptional regulator [Butyricicoccus porcorum]OUM21892.1 transcriptional regulator [Butyricicoccus porcorum]